MRGGTGILIHQIRIVVKPVRPCGERFFIRLRKRRLTEQRKRPAVGEYQFNRMGRHRQRAYAAYRFVPAPHYPRITLGRICSGYGVIPAVADKRSPPFYGLKLRPVQYTADAGAKRRTDFSAPFRQPYDVCVPCKQPDCI